MSKAASFTISAEAVGDRRVKVVASTPDVDSAGTRLLPRGCDTAAFLRNPIVLWGHRRDGDPDDAIGQVVDLQITDTAIVATVEFDDDAKAMACLRKVRKGIIRSVSVGFLTVEQTEPDANGIVTVTRWELRELSFCHVPANSHALVVRAFKLRAAQKFAAARTSEKDGARSTSTNAGARSPANTRSFSSMNEILSKLGLKDGAGSDEIVAALIKYIKESPDSDADKAALCSGLLSMLTPTSDASDGAKAAAAEAMADEVKKLQARVAELEDQTKAATTAAEPTAEQRADAAIKDGRWPAGQRAALVEQYRTNKAPFLFAAKSFSTRSVTFTKGGNPATAAKSSPTFEPKGSSAGKSILARVDAQLAGRSAE